MTDLLLRRHGALAAVIAGCMLSSAPQTAAAQAPPGRSSGAATWLLAPRYATAGEAALLAGRISPRWAIVEEFTFDVHSSEWSLGVATGPQFHMGQSRFIVIVGPVTGSGSSWYAGLYVAPTVPLWRLTASGTIELFFPVTAGARFEYEVSHARLLATLTPRLRAGGFFHLVKSVGDPARVELGPSLRVGVAPDLKFTVDAAHGLANTPSEIILSAQWEP